MPTAPTRVEGDLHVNGGLSAKTMTLAAASVADAQVSAGADIAATKVNHQHRAMFAQPNTTATAETKIIYRCYGTTGTLIEFAAGSIAPCTGNATITVDLHKNGVTVLSAPITLDNANAARVAEVGTISDSALVAANVLEVIVAVAAGTGALGTGLFASATINEAPQ